MSKSFSQKNIVSIWIYFRNILTHEIFCPKSDGEHQARFWPAAGAEQPGAEQLGYQDTDASTPDPGAVLPAPNADDGHPE